MLCNQKHLSKYGNAKTCRKFRKETIEEGKMKRSIIALVALALVQCHERPELGEFSCIKEAPGFYCTNDLAGYLNCSETVNIKKNCSNGTVVVSSIPSAQLQNQRYVKHILLLQNSQKTSIIRFFTKMF